MTEQPRVSALHGRPLRHPAAGSSQRSSRWDGRRQARKRRLSGLIRFAVFLLLIFIAVWAGVRVAHAGEGGDIYSGTPYVVHQGDDLWTIAAVEYGGVDLRKAVFAIRQANDLQASSLEPGQQLTLPYLEE